jgi:hypothetical protein
VRPVPPEVLTAQVVKNLQDGDFVWVTVSTELDEDEASSVHEVVSSLLPEGVNLLVTRGDYIKSIKVTAIDDLLVLQRAVERTIHEYTTARAIEA